MPPPPRPHRYFVRAPGGRAIFGFDRLEAATVAALEMPAGAHLVDTQAQAYFPVVQEVRPAGTGSDAKKELVYLPIGGWDAGRRGLDDDLVEAVRRRHIAIVHAHLAKGASARARDAKGGSALHWAAATGDRDIVALLLAHGAVRDVVDAKGQTPAEVATARGHTAVAALLAGN